MKKHLSIVFLITALAYLSGCALTPGFAIDEGIARYEQAAKKVELGDNKEYVLSTLEPTQAEISSRWKKPPDKYIKSGVRVEIYYFRSRRQADGITTDDEFTPYVFNDGKLLAIGWAAIGGPKTQGQTTPVTNINVEQSTVVY